MSVEVTVHGFGYKYSCDIDIAEYPTVLEAARYVCRLYKHPELAEGSNISYLRNWRRAAPGDLLSDGDVLTVTAVLCGG